MAAYSESRYYRYTPEQLYPLCVDSLGQAGGVIDPGSSPRTILVAATPIAWIGLEARVRFEVSLIPQASGETQVQLEMFPLAMFGNRALVGGGKGAAKRGQMFFTTLEEAVNFYSRNEFVPRTPVVAASLPAWSGCLGLVLSLVLAMIVCYLTSALVDLDITGGGTSWFIFWIGLTVVAIGIFWVYHKIFARPPKG